MTNAEVLPAVIPTDTAHAVDSYRVATNAATLCAEIVKATATKIQGKKYVQVEGWLSIAAAHGCLVSIAKVEKVDGGISATAELRRHSDGLVLATAEGFVGDDERTWANRPMYARRAMAQTRASSRVCRSAFAHVVVLIDRDLGTTPAEEMMGVIENGGTVDGPGSSWGPGGKQSAVEEAERDGLTKDAPKETDAVRKAREEKIAKCKQKVEDSIAVFKMVGQSPQVLQAYWDRNAEIFEWINERLPDLYERLEREFNDAKDAAEARAA
jgi:hypothetical protein